MLDLHFEKTSSHFLWFIARAKFLFWKKETNEILNTRSFGDLGLGLI